MKKYYKDGNNLIATNNILDLPEITAEEYNAEMDKVKQRIEEQLKNFVPLPTETERLEALEQAFMEFVGVVVNG